MIRIVSVCNMHETATHHPAAFCYVSERSLEIYCRIIKSLFCCFFIENMRSLMVSQNLDQYHFWWIVDFRPIVPPVSHEPKNQFRLNCQPFFFSSFLVLKLGNMWNELHIWPDSRYKFMQNESAIIECREP